MKREAFRTESETSQSVTRRGFSRRRRRHRRSIGTPPYGRLARSVRCMSSLPFCSRRCRSARASLIRRASREPALIPGAGPAPIALGFALGLRIVVGPGSLLAFCAGLHKAVSDTQLGDQNLRGVGMRLDLLAQLANEDA